MTAAKIVIRTDAAANNLIFLCRPGAGHDIGLPRDAQERKPSGTLGAAPTRSAAG
jgi:hypothetical protein